MKRNLHKLCPSRTIHVNHGEIRRYTSLGDMIRNAKEQGIGFDGVAESVFDDVDTDAIDPLSNPRTDRFDLLEQATDEAYIKALKDANQRAGQSVPASAPTTAEPASASEGGEHKS